MIHPLAPSPLCNSGGYFHVAVADTFDANRHDPVGTYCSRKLNGVRCLIHLRSGQDPTYYTKTGRQITGLDKITEALAPCLRDITDLVIDGELSLSTPDGADDFNTLVSVIQKKNHVIDRPRFHAFDLIPGPNFAAGRWSTKFIDRRLTLDLLTFDADPEFFVLHPQERINNRAHLESTIARAVQMGWEGLVLRQNAPYSGQITEDLLRLKLWQDTEVPIVGFGTDTQGISSIQVTLFGRSLQFTRDQLPPGSLAPFCMAPSKILEAQATIAWDDGKAISNVRIAAIYPGGRKF
jgi:ATP-dependent DNA ligase